MDQPHRLAHRQQRVRLGGHRLRVWDHPRQLHVRAEPESAGRGRDSREAAVTPSPSPPRAPSTLTANNLRGSLPKELFAADKLVQLCVTGGSRQSSSLPSPVDPHRLCPPLPRA